MIFRSEVSKIIDYFSYIFFFGLENQYSKGVIENRIADSENVKTMENEGEANFLYTSSITKEISKIYQIEEANIKIEPFLSLDTISMWVAEAYLRLFFKYHKSFEYLFLYIPLERMIDMFDVYHEMGWGHLFDYFEKVTIEKSLLRLALSKKHLSINKLSILTGISGSTLTTYLSNKRLKEAKFENIFRIAHALDVGLNIFAEKVNNTLDIPLYQDEKLISEDIFSTLAIYMVGYFSHEFAKRNYVYDKENGLYSYKNLKLKVLTKSFLSSGNTFEMINKYIGTIPEKDKKNYSIIVYENGEESRDISPYKELVKNGLEAIYIVNQYNVICIKESYWVSQVDSSLLDKLSKRAAD